MKNVLVVDDETLVAESIADALEALGLQVAWASDPVEAWARLDEKTPDLILLDVSLGGTSGLDLLRELKGRCPAPVALITAAPEKIDAESLARVAGVLRKPFGYPALKALLKEVLP